MNRRIGLIVVLLLVLGGGWWWHAGQPGLDDSTATMMGAAMPPLPVIVTTVQQRDMPVELHAVGQVRPVQTVSVRAQVSGVLKKVAFQEGDRVDAGDVLFEIDPRPFKAAVARARAALAHDQAALANAQSQYKRLEPLAQKDFVTASELDNAHTAVKQAKAAVAEDQAQLEDARIKLSYTRITAPIRGRTGSVALDVGNVVEANGSTPLVVINQMAPIDIRFAIPQADLARVRRYRADNSIRVAVDPGDLLQTPVPARLVFIDNAVDEDTGTVSLKARADNDAARLWPGQFVSVALTLTVETDALVVPTVAVQPGQKGHYVFRVADGVAHVRPVQVERQQGDWTIISSGLQAGDRIVARVPRTLTDGSRVSAREQSDMSAAAS